MTIFWLYSLHAACKKIVFFLSNTISVFIDLLFYCVIFISLAEAVAPSDSCFWAPCTYILTYLLTLLFGLQLLLRLFNWPSFLFLYISLPSPAVLLPYAFLHLSVPIHSSCSFVPSPLLLFPSPTPSYIQLLLVELLGQRAL